MEKASDLFKPNCIRTFSGKYVNVFEPTEDMICIEDIAHALSHQCRFGGHLPRFYSVAEHSILCSQLVFGSKTEKFNALMHDASEAYLLDIPSPIKKGLANYKDLEDGLMHVIANKFGFEWPMTETVRQVDERMLHYEWNAIMLNEGESKITIDSRVYELFNYDKPEYAKHDFIKQFNILKQK